MWGLVSPEIETEFGHSLFAQAEFLSRDMEYDVRGNHLLENIRALIFVGLLYSTKESLAWYNLAMDALERATAEQILPDGGHF